MTTTRDEGRHLWFPNADDTSWDLVIYFEQFNISFHVHSQIMCLHSEFLKALYEAAKAQETSV